MGERIANVRAVVEALATCGGGEEEGSCAALDFVGQLKEAVWRYKGKQAFLSKAFAASDELWSRLREDGAVVTDKQSAHPLHAPIFSLDLSHTASLPSTPSHSHALPVLNKPPRPSQSYPPLVQPGPLTSLSPSPSQSPPPPGLHEPLPPTQPHPRLMLSEPLP